jgi:hypothetical protein
MLEKTNNTKKLEKKQPKKPTNMLEKTDNYKYAGKNQPTSRTAINLC